MRSPHVLFLLCLVFLFCVYDPNTYFVTFYYKFMYNSSDMCVLIMCFSYSCVLRIMRSKGACWDLTHGLKQVRT